MSGRRGEVTRLLLLLLLELLLVLLGNRRHCWHARGHALLRSLAEAGKLRLQARIAGVLLLQRCLTEAGWLRDELARLRLLLLLLLLWLPSPSAEGVAILRSTGAHGVAAEV